MEPIPDRELLEFQGALFRHQAWYACFNAVLQALVPFTLKQDGDPEKRTPDEAIEIAQNYATAIHGHVPDMP